MRRGKQKWDSWPVTGDNDTQICGWRKSTKHPTMLCSPWMKTDPNWPPSCGSYFWWRSIACLLLLSDWCVTNILYLYTDLCTTCGASAQTGSCLASLVGVCRGFYRDHVGDLAFSCGLLYVGQKIADLLPVGLVILLFHGLSEFCLNPSWHPHDASVATSWKWKHHHHHQLKYLEWPK